jgi:hypothetical protein
MLLIHLHGDVLSFNLCTMQSLLRASRVFLSPKLYYSRTVTEASLGTRRGERAIGTEEIVKLGIGEGW